jgi:NTP pyrophosphatase (non-canonical NTP hydrolase)
MNYEALMNDFVSFALKTFNEADPLSSMNKLEEEMEEVSEAILHGHENLAEEYADCMMCLLDSAARLGIQPDDLMIAFAAKLQVNKNRNWVKNADNTYSHLA